MKSPSIASLKKVTTGNLARLGPERLAALLIDVAEGRPELKRRLRMELAAEHGAEHLALEIDKQLTTLQTSRTRVSWRKRAAFVRDLDVLRALISERLSGLGPAMALGRMWQFMALAEPLDRRVRDRNGELEAIFEQAAVDIGALMKLWSGPEVAPALVEAILHNPAGWADWLGPVLQQAPTPLAKAVLALILPHRVLPGWTDKARRLADAAGDVDAFRATFSANELRAPRLAAEVARRLMEQGRLAEVGPLLDAARPSPSKLQTDARPTEADFAWETVWIDYLDATGQGEAAQAARWASFERALSVERARAFTRRLSDFDDVEAEGRAFDYAARHADFERALAFLMAWPALPEAARMIDARRDDIRVSVENAELWASQLRNRQPEAAHTLLRQTAAAAFKRRELKTAERLTQEADDIHLDV